MSLFFFIITSSFIKLNDPHTLTFYATDKTKLKVQKFHQLKLPNNSIGCGDDFVASI